MASKTFSGLFERLLDRAATGERPSGFMRRTLRYALSAAYVED